MTSSPTSGSATGERRVPRGRAMAAGALAAGLALAVTALVDGLWTGVPSLVVAVGDWVIDSAPPAVEQWAIATLGTADKPALIGGTVVLSLAAGALLGVVAERRWWLGAAGLVAFGVFGAWAASRDGSWAGGVVAAGFSVVAGVAALWWLLSTARHDAREPVTADDASHGRRVPVSGTMEPRGDRRSFLMSAGTTAVAAIAAAVTGRVLTQGRSAGSSPPPVALPSAAIPAPEPSPPVSFDVDGLHPWVTPNEEFFRIDTALRIPRVDLDTWRLAFTGMVDRPFELTYDDLLAMPLEEHYITLACVSNEVGGELVDNARWLGVRLDTLLERAGVQAGADQIVGRSVDGFTAGFPTGVAFDGRDALVAVGMNGEPLPPDHGFPARLVVPGLFGYVSATKWLSEVELTTLAGFDAYWIPRGWAKFGPIVTQSQIDVPRAGATIPAGRTAVAGIAYAPTRGIADVEVRVDDGPWRAAELGAPYNEDTWRQWLFAWEADPGVHQLTVRATDGDGEVQIAEVSPVAPDGATGLHSIEVTVT